MTEKAQAESLIGFDAVENGPEAHHLQVTPPPKQVLTKESNLFDPESLPDRLKKSVSYHTVERGQPLFCQGDRVKGLFLLRSGLMRLVHYTEQGQLINHYVIYPGEVFAEIVLFVDCYACTAIADQPSEVMMFSKTLVLEELKNNPAFAEAFMAKMAERLHMTKILLELRGLRSARDRVIHYLEVLAEPGSSTLTLTRSLRSIAADLGLSPEALSRTLAQLRKEGIVSRTKRQLTYYRVNQRSQ